MKFYLSYVVRITLYNDRDDEAIRQLEFNK